MRYTDRLSKPIKAPLRAIKLPFSFLDTPEEWHAFVVGFFEGFTLFIPSRFEPAKGRGLVEHEFWYYQFGRGTGMIAVVLIGVGIAKLIDFVF